MNAINCWEAQFNSEQSHFNYTTLKTGIESEDLFPEIKEFHNTQSSSKTHSAYVYKQGWIFSLCVLLDVPETSPSLLLQTLQKVFF